FWRRSTAETVVTRSASAPAKSAPSQHSPLTGPPTAWPFTARRSFPPSTAAACSLHSTDRGTGLLTLRVAITSFTRGFHPPALPAVARSLRTASPADPNRRVTPNIAPPEWRLLQTGPSMFLTT